MKHDIKAPVTEKKVVHKVTEEVKEAPEEKEASEQKENTEPKPFSFGLSQSSFGAVSSGFGSTAVSSGFGSTAVSSAFGSTAGGFSFGGFAKKEETSKEDGEEGEEEAVKAEEVVEEVEEEGAVYSKKCKLFYKKEEAWVERGLGQLHLKVPEEGKVQVLLPSSPLLPSLPPPLPSPPLSPFPPLPSTGGGEGGHQPGEHPAERAGDGRHGPREGRQEQPDAGHRPQPAHRPQGRAQAPPLPRQVRRLSSLSSLATPVLQYTLHPAPVLRQGEDGRGRGRVEGEADEPRQGRGQGGLSLTWPHLVLPGIIWQPGPTCSHVATWPPPGLYQAST